MVGLVPRQRGLCARHQRAADILHRAGRCGRHDHGAGRRRVQSPIAGQTVTADGHGGQASSGVGPRHASGGVVNFEDAGTGTVIGTAPLVSGIATYHDQGALKPARITSWRSIAATAQDFAGSTSTRSSVTVVPEPLPVPSVASADAGGAYNGSIYPATATVMPPGGSPAPTLEGVSPTLAYYAGSTATRHPAGRRHGGRGHVHGGGDFPRQHGLRPGHQRAGAVRHHPGHAAA